MHHADGAWKSRRRRTGMPDCHGGKARRGAVCAARQPLSWPCPLTRQGNPGSCTRRLFGVGRQRSGSRWAGGWERRKPAVAPARAGEVPRACRHQLECRGTCSARNEGATAHHAWVAQHSQHAAGCEAPGGCPAPASYKGSPWRRKVRSGGRPSCSGLQVHAGSGAPARRLGCPGSPAADAGPCRAPAERRRRPCSPMLPPCGGRRAWRRPGSAPRAAAHGQSELRARRACPAAARPAAALLLPPTAAPRPSASPAAAGQGGQHAEQPDCQHPEVPEEVAGQGGHMVQPAGPQGAPPRR